MNLFLTFIRVDPKHCRFHRMAADAIINQPYTEIHTQTQFSCFNVDHGIADDLQDKKP